MVRVGDNVTVLGIEGINVVVEVASALQPCHPYAQIILGHIYGRFLVGDTVSVEAWRCEIEKVDLEDFPCGAI